jgi:hypothetical protein
MYENGYLIPQRTNHRHCCQLLDIYEYRHASDMTLILLEHQYETAANRLSSISMHYTQKYETNQTQTVSTTSIHYEYSSNFKVKTMLRPEEKTKDA